MKFYLPFSKAERQDDGTIVVTGIASTEAKDSHGEVVKAEAMKAAIPDYMAFGGTGALREMHQQIAAGIVFKAEVNDKGETHVEARVVDANSVKKVEAGVFKGFSIGGKVLKKTGNTIEELQLREISLVDRPANPEALLSVFKADGIDSDEPIVEIKKSLYTTSRLADLLASLKSLESSDSYENNGVESAVSPSIKAACKALSAALVASATLEAGKATAKADDGGDIAKNEGIDIAKVSDLLAPITKGLADLGTDLRKSIDEQRAAVDELAKRVKSIEEQPAPAKAVTSTISKAGETGGGEPMSDADLAKALAALPEAERTRLVMKAALASPMTVAA